MGSLAPGVLAANPLRGAAYSDAATFQAVDFDDPDHDYTTVSGLADLPCRLMSVYAMDGDTQAWALQAGASHVVQFPARHDDLREDMRPQINGEPYQLLRIRHRSDELTQIAVSGTDATP